MENSIIYLVQQLVRLNKIAFDKEELSFQIQSHPSFPSLHSITGVLDHFGIDNISLDIPATEEVYSQLPNVFFAQVKGKSEDEFVVVVKKGKTVTCIYSPKERVTFTIPEFLEKFTGIIVAIEQTEAIKTKAPKTGFINSLLLICLGIIVSGLLLFSAPSLIGILYLCLSIIGLVISIAIVKENLGIQNSLGDTFCSATDVKKDCSKVIGSNGAKVLGFFKLSDLSLVYFSSLSIASLFAVLQGIDFSLLLAMGLLSVPVVIYSVYYQYAIAKTWCPLCLLIAGTLLLQTVVAGFYFSELIPVKFNLRFVAFVVSVFLSTTFIWNLLSSKIENLLTLKQSKIDYFKFKRNFDLFKTVLEKSPRISTEISATQEIILGTKNAPVSIVVITSPYCGHCKPVHKQIVEILRIYKGLVSVTIRIPVETKDTDASLFKITSRLIEIYHTQGEETCLQAMHDIYSGMEVTIWLATWDACTNSACYTEILEAQSSWCKDNGINFTPEILVNGRSFPKEYMRQDLALFIESLAEDCPEYPLATTII